MSHEIVNFARRLAGTGRLVEARTVLEVLNASDEASLESQQYLLDVLAYQNDVPACLAALKAGLDRGFAKLAPNQFYFNVVPKIAPGAETRDAIARLEDIVACHPAANRFAKISLGALLASNGELDRAIQSNLEIFGREHACPVDRLRGPEFVVIGTLKGGTTSFFNYLSRHPGIRPALFKEVRYFSNPASLKHGPTWYFSHFPQRKGFISGEATPGYFSSSGVPERMRAVIPDARLFLCLRDPAKRALSHYHMELREGRTSKTIEQLLEECRRAIPGPGQLRDGAIYSQPEILTHSFYVHHVSRWLEHFDRKQLHVVRAEALSRQPQRELDAASDFLGLPAFTVEKEVRSNAGEYAPSEQTLAALREYLQPFSEGLDTLLDCRFDWLDRGSALAED